MGNQKNKKGGKFVSFLRAVFVHNIDLKIFAILFSLIVCLLVMGLKTRPVATAEKSGEQPASESAITRII